MLRFWKSDSQLDHESLSESSRKASVNHACDCHGGDGIVTLRGRVKSITLEPKNLRRFEAEIMDGTGVVNCVWIGQTYVVGILPGTRMQVCGRVVEDKNSFLTMYNPSYTLLPRGKG